MATFHVIAGASETPENPAIRKIGIGDLRQALIKGWADFAAFPSQALFIVLIYPIVGFILLQLAIGNATLPLLFPLVAGFALVGPLAAVGLYELSRRRELGLVEALLAESDRERIDLWRAHRPRQQRRDHR